MIEFKLFFALISYYFVMFVTPGPNNAMLTASGIKFGFKKTIPHLIGIPFGHTIQITLSLLWFRKFISKISINSKLFEMAYALFIYFILGWKIIGSFSDHEKDSGRPLKLYEAAHFSNLLILRLGLLR